jgi:hypothetical protein
MEHPRRPLLKRTAAVGAALAGATNVGPVVPGDVMTGHIDRLYDINVKVVTA